MSFNELITAIENSTFWKCFDIISTTTGVILLIPIFKIYNSVKQKNILKRIMQNPEGRNSCVLGIALGEKSESFKSAVLNHARLNEKIFNELNQKLEEDENCFFIFDNENMPTDDSQKANKYIEQFKNKLADVETKMCMKNITRIHIFCKMPAQIAMIMGAEFHNKYQVLCYQYDVGKYILIGEFK